MKKLLKMSSLAALIFAAQSLEAKVTLSNMWGDNMVIQRNQDVLFSGEASKGKQVKITPSWSAQSYTATVAKGGAWSVKIPTPDAGGPYEVTFTDGESLTLNNVLLGDVWLCMGQSNMALPVKGSISQPVAGSSRVISQAQSSRNIRLFNMPKRYLAAPEAKAEGEWTLNTPEAVAEFSAAGYFFGCDIESAIGVPIGLVNLNYGGTMIETWMSREWLAKVKEYDHSQIAGGKVPKNFTKIPTVFYNGMVAPIKGMNVTGALWYQGEGNRPNADEYLKLFPAFVEGLRSHLSSGEFPFYYVEIAPFGANKDESGVYMREIMGQLMDLTPRTGMVSIVDKGEAGCIHPRYKKEVGERLALWALGDCYGIAGFEYRAPEYSDMKVEKMKWAKTPCIALNFNHCKMGLCFGNEVESELFEIAGEDKVFHPAKVRLVRGKNSAFPLYVWSESVTNPVAVRYAYKNTVKGDVFSTSGMPVPSFRTDKWSLK